MAEELEDVFGQDRFRRLPVVHVVGCTSHNEMVTQQAGSRPSCALVAAF